MDIQEIINNIAAGENVVAKEGLENVLSAKAFDALQGFKQEIASTLYGGQEQSHEEVTDDEEAYAEEVEHDGEQLDEVSFKTATNAYKARRSKEQDYHPGGPTGPENVTKSGKYKSSQTANRMVKKFGDRAVNRIDRLEKTYG